MVIVEPLETRSSGSNSIVADKKIEGSFELDKIHVFENLLFEFDRFRLLDPAKKEMLVLYDYLNKENALKITISGHTDSVGSDTYNLWLSKKRSEAVAHYLLKLGLNKDRIDWEGHGGSKPSATNANENGRQQNRRVEFVISKASIK